MPQYARGLGTVLALIVGALVFWLVSGSLFDLTDLMIERLGPIWTLVIVGGVTLVLGIVWLRYGAAGALARWGVTIQPASPPDDGSDPGEADATPRGDDADRSGTAGRPRPGRSR